MRNSRLIAIETAGDAIVAIETAADAIVAIETAADAIVAIETAADAINRPDLSRHLLFGTCGVGLDHVICWFKFGGDEKFALSAGSTHR